MNNSGHFSDVKVHTDVQRFAGLLFLLAIVQLTVKLMVNSPAGQIGKLAAQISLNQLRRIRLHKGWNVVCRQILFVVEG